MRELAAQWGRGDYQRTYAGIDFYPLDPRPEDIAIEDIAHALSMQCRYGGHTKQHYSIASHSIEVAAHCSRPNMLWGLLHDASEAYLNDIPRPAKMLLPDYKKLEETVMRAVAEKFKLPWPEPKEVKEIDTRILVNEIRVVLPHNSDIDLTYLGEPLEDCDISLWMGVPPEAVEEEFMYMFRELTNE